MKKQKTTTAEEREALELEEIDLDDLKNALGGSNKGPIMQNNDWQMAEPIRPLPFPLPTLPQLG